MQYRFASEEWLAAAQDILAQRASSLAAQGFKDRVSICEVYRNCPSDLGWKNDELAWSCVYQDGHADFQLAERDDVSFKIRGNYDAFAPIAIFEIGDDPSRAEKFGQLVAQGLERGEIAVEIGEGFTEPGDLEPFHDVLARMTCLSGTGAA